MSEPTPATAENMTDATVDAMSYLEGVITVAMATAMRDKNVPPIFALQAGITVAANFLTVLSIDHKVPHEELLSNWDAIIANVRKTILIERYEKLVEVVKLRDTQVSA
jgi:hypothetical protein